MLAFAATARDCGKGGHRSNPLDAWSCMVGAVSSRLNIGIGFRFGIKDHASRLEVSMGLEPLIAKVLEGRG